MALDRNHRPDGKGKYALIHLRYRPQSSFEIHSDLRGGEPYYKVPVNAVSFGTEAPDRQFFVFKYADIFTHAALQGYVDAVHRFVAFQIGMPEDVRNELSQYAVEIGVEERKAYKVAREIPNIGRAPQSLIDQRLAGDPGNTLPGNDSVEVFNCIATVTGRYGPEPEEVPITEGTGLGKEFFSKPDVHLIGEPGHFSTAAQNLADRLAAASTDEVIGHAGTPFIQADFRASNPQIFSAEKPPVGVPPPLQGRPFWWCRKCSTVVDKKQWPPCQCKDSPSPWEWVTAPSVDELAHLSDRITNHLWSPVVPEKAYTRELLVDVRAALRWCQADMTERQRDMAAAPALAEFKSPRTSLWWAFLPIVLGCAIGAAICWAFEKFVMSR